MRLTLATLIFFITSMAHAELFRNAYVSFELPPNWNCKLEKTEWVCTSKYAKNVKEAIIILTAKEAGPQDSIASYKNKLKTPRQVPNKKGQYVASKVHSVGEKILGGHKWVDSLHEGSEIASYYTRYLATIKDRLAILVTFSAHKAHYTKYSNDFLKAVKSLKVIASKDLLSGQPNVATGVGQNEMIGGPIGTLPSGGDLAPPPTAKSNNLTVKLIALALILGAIAILILRKKK